MKPLTFITIGIGIFLSGSPFEQTEMSIAI